MPLTSARLATGLAFVAISAFATTIHAQARPFLDSAAAATLGQPVGVDFLPDGELVIFHRGLGDPAPRIVSATVAVVDPATGTLLRTWGADAFMRPHGLHVTDRGDVWLTDTERHQAFRYSPDGELLATLGEEGVPGADSLHFDQPTDVAVAPDGSVFVADGYGNRRIVKFDADGRYLTEWGREGQADGEFLNPHALELAGERLYVADRDNARIQVFDLAGRHLQTIADSAAVYACVVGADSGALTLTDFLERDGVVLGSAVTRLPNPETPSTTLELLGRPGGDGATPCRYHDVAVGADGSVYLPDLLSREVHRLSPGG